MLGLLARAGGAWVAAVAVAALLALPICDLAFDCGCRPAGFGGWDGCDIHVPGPPDCPWCASRSAWVGSLLFAAGLAAATASWAAVRRQALAWIVLSSAAAAVAGLLVAGAAVALRAGRVPFAGS